MNSIKIGNTEIGDDKPVYVVAEAGSMARKSGAAFGS